MLQNYNLHSWHQDRMEKARQHEQHLEIEKRHLQEELSRCENRASKLDLQRIALEGDIQRLQMALQDKENQARNIQERLDNQCRSTAQIEDRYVRRHPYSASTNSIHFQMYCFEDIR